MTARPHLSPRPFVAVALGIAVFSLMDAAMKRASIDAGVYVALLLRGLFGTLLVLPFWLAAGARRPRREALKVHGARGVVVAAMALLFFWGLVRLPMAEGIALSFIAPLIALYLAAAMLGERIRRSALLASLLGLGGVGLIAAARLVANPGGGSPAAIAAILGSAMLYALNLVLQRRQAQLAAPVEIALFQSAIVMLALLPAAPWLGGWPQPRVLADIALAATLASAALALFAWGYARAEAQFLLPLEYTAFGWSALFGWLWFGEVVGPAAVLGTALIVTGCWIAARVSAAARPGLPAP